MRLGLPEGAMAVPPDPIPRDALLRAAEVLGGRERLAQTLGVKADELARWMRGDSSPPAAIVFAALNLVERGRR